MENGKTINRIRRKKRALQAFFFDIEFMTRTVACFLMETSVAKSVLALGKTVYLLFVIKYKTCKKSLVRLRTL